MPLLEPPLAIVIEKQSLGSLGKRHLSSFRPQLLTPPSGCFLVDRQVVSENIFYEDDPVDVSSPSEADEAAENVETYLFWLALQRIAVATPSAQEMSDELAGLDHLG